MQVLVFRGGALGDFLVTLPALRALQRRWPGSRVTVVGNRRAAELGILDGCIQEVHDQHEGRWATLFGNPELPEELRQWLQAFDLVINYWPDPDGQLSRHFAARRERFVAGTAQVTSRPAARHFLEPLERLGCVAEEWAPKLRIPNETMAEASRATADDLRLIAIHPGSGSPRKSWPLRRWHEVAASLAHPVLWITGEAEEDLQPPPHVYVIQARQWRWVGSPLRSRVVTFISATTRASAIWRRQREQREPFCSGRLTRQSGRRPRRGCEWSAVRMA